MSAPRRTVWISGASSGIGKAVAHACHHRGDRLILSARRSGRLDALRDESGPDALVVPFDLSATQTVCPNWWRQTWEAVLAAWMW